MPTEKPAIMAYLTPRTHAQLIAFKTKKRIRSLSQTVEEILQEYFEHLPSDEVKCLSFAQQLDCLLQEQQSLRAKFSDLEKSTRSITDSNKAELTASQKISAANNESVCCSQLEQKHDCPSVLSNNSAEIVPEAENQRVELTGEVNKKGLTGVQLADRLKTNCSMISRRRLKPDFSEWSRFNDPNSLSWTYVPSIRRFYPLP
jgi:hypothetical protein